MPCFAPWNFVDNLGQIWALAMNAAGQLTFTQLFPPAGNNAIRSVPLVDLANLNTYAVSVVFTTQPILTPTLSSGPGITPNYIPLTRPGVGSYRLQVSGGALVANPVGDGPGTADPVIGELFNYDIVNPPLNPPNLPNAGLVSGEPGGWLPNYTQPGGLGTQSFPAQQSGVPYSSEPSNIGLPTPDTGVPIEVGMGLNTAGCGHWFNNFEQTFTTVACQEVCVIRCPLCGYLVQIISPASLAYTANYEHISS